MEWIYVVSWIIGGFIAWCGTMGDFYSIWKSEPSWWDRERPVGLASLVAILGPLGAIIVMLGSGFFKNGFKVW